MLKSKTKFAREARKRGSAFSLQPSAFACSAFTLIEMLVVIAILGLMAGLTVPVLKNFAKSDATLGASRQLLDGVARARQLAISQRTTVYMVFVPQNFWTIAGPFPNSWWTGLTPAQQTAATNLCDRQFTGYTFVSLRSVGDQPGVITPRYLGPWQTLPDGTFIATNKFISPGQYYSIAQYDPIVRIYGFVTNTAIPFPTADSPTKIPLPYIAFNYLGQLATNGPNGVGMSIADEYIPIAKGSVLYARDPVTKRFQFNSPDASEMPPGNSTNSSYNIVHIDRLTGRAVLEFQKMQ
jgi:prepilin-type N-terminal cleavage/methylation domain-containing protein